MTVACVQWSTIGFMAMTAMFCIGLWTIDSWWPFQ